MSDEYLSVSITIVLLRQNWVFSDSNCALVFQSEDLDKCEGNGEGMGGGTRLDSRDGNLCHLGIGIQRGRETKSPGLVGGWGDQVPMTREVSDKCQGVVWWSWDKFTAYVDLQHVSILEAREGSRKTRVKGDVERERRYY